jgi:hypothetical protein
LELIDSSYNTTLVNLYYNYVAGETPENENDYNYTKLLFDYLIESGLDKKEIILSVLEDFPNKEKLTIEDIPDNLWNNSLIRRNTFYYHPELQIISPPPTWDKCYPFYLEMKIKYTIEDILKYFIKRFKLNEEWVNKDKEIGSIKYLLNSYKKYNFIEPVDFILHLIDYVISIDVKVETIYDLTAYELQLADYLETDIENAKSKGKNKIIWRMDVCGI